MVHFHAQLLSRERACLTNYKVTIIYDLCFSMFLYFQFPYKGENYRLKLFATTRDGLQGMSAYDFTTALPPTGGICGINPSSGISLKTDFNLTCIDWKSDQNPLSYKFHYQLENGARSMLYQGLNNSVISWLPSGDILTDYSIKLILTVTDKVGASAPAVYLLVKVGC